jgi:hypothetical protein
MGDWKDRLILELQQTGIQFDRTDTNLVTIGESVFQLIGSESEPTFEQKGIIIHQDVFERKAIQLVSRIKSIVGQNLSTVYARDTSVLEITKEQASEFINDNHLIGFGGGKTFLGLRDDTELVAVAVFSKILYMKYEDPPYHSVELERYCSLVDTTVVGGLDKMIKAYLKEFEVDDIVTYVDKEWMDTSRASVSGYGKLGFEVVRETEPLTFKVNKENWKRELVRDVLPLSRYVSGPPPKGEDLSFDSAQDDKNFYYVKNRGNLKMRLKVQ